MLLDDPSPLVRACARRGARVASPTPPAVVMHALAADQPEIAALGARALAAAARCRSGRCGRDRRRRSCRSRSPAARHAAALGRRGDRRGRRRARPAWCCSKTPAPTSRRSRSTASSSASAIWRRSARSCSRAHDLPAATRQALVAKLSRDARRLRHRAQMAGARAPQRIAQEACEKATVALAAETPDERGRRR